MDKDRREDQPLRNESEQPLTPQEGTEEVNGIPDLDGDGMIGNTGGFYGGTTYLGSNFGPDWSGNAAEGEGNYGAAGAKDEDEAGA